MTTTIIKDFLRELWANAIVSTRILINLWNTVPNSMVTCLNNSKYAKTTVTTLGIQNYHCAPRGDSLSLTFKNYHEFIFIWILWLHNLFRNLTTNYAWNDYVSSKATKLRKLVTGATNVETHIQKYHYKARNSSYVIIPLHVDSNGWRSSCMHFFHI